MGCSSPVYKSTQPTLESLAERLCDGPLTSLMALQRRAEAVAAEQLSGDELIESLQDLVILAQSGMIAFHEFTAELRAFVDRLAYERVEESTDEALVDRL
jgi:hypothetical protein